MQAGEPYTEQDRVREQESTSILFRRIYLKESKYLERPEKNQTSGVLASAALLSSVAPPVKRRAPGVRWSGPAAFRPFPKKVFTAVCK